MKNIDFLPNRYREQGSVRKSQIWRFTLLLLFCAGIGATAAGQYTLRRAVVDRLDSIETQHQMAQSKSELHDRLQTQLADVLSTAQLYAYLNHPWPRTQLLAAVVRPMPEAITLSEFRLLRENQQSAQNGRFPERSLQGENQTELAPGLPSQRDLKLLRGELGSAQYNVRLTGYTKDAGSLHLYLGQLSDSYYFIKAELISLESTKSESQGGDLEFTLRLIVRPGYSLEGGPSLQPQEVSAASPSLIDDLHAALSGDL